MMIKEMRSSSQFKPKVLKDTAPAHPRSLSLCGMSQHTLYICLYTPGAR